jgi:hypothetical protein
MGLADHSVPQAWIESTQVGQHIDHRLYAFPWPEQSPGQDRRVSPPRLPTTGGRRVGRAVRDHNDLRRTDVVGLQQSRACGHRHGDYSVGELNHPLENLALVAGRRPEHRVQDHDGWHSETVEHTEDLVAIGSAVDSELVLDDRHIKLIERGRGPLLRGDRPRNEVSNDTRPDDRFWLIDNPNDSGTAARRDKSGSKRRGKRGEATLGRGVGT